MSSTTSASVVAQLQERLLPISEVRGGSMPVIRNYLLNIFAVNYLHTKIKKKRPIMTHLKINLSRTIPNLTNLHNNTSCKCILQTVARFFLQYLFFHNNDLCPIA